MAAVKFLNQEPNSNLRKVPSYPFFYLTRPEQDQVGSPTDVVHIEGLTDIYLIHGRVNSCFASSTFIEEGCVPNRYFGWFQAVMCSPYQDPNLITVFGLVPIDAIGVSLSWSDGTVRAFNPNKGLVDFTVSRRSATYPKRVNWWWNGHLFSTPSGVPVDWRQGCLTKLSQVAINRKNRANEGFGSDVHF